MRSLRPYMIVQACIFLVYLLIEINGIVIGDLRLGFVSGDAFKGKASPERNGMGTGGQQKSGNGRGELHLGECGCVVVKKVDVDGC